MNFWGPEGKVPFTTSFWVNATCTDKLEVLRSRVNDQDCIGRSPFGDTVPKILEKTLVLSLSLLTHVVGFVPHGGPQVVAKIADNNHTSTHKPPLHVEHMNRAHGKGPGPMGPWAGFESIDFP